MKKQVLCTAMVVTLLLSTTASATTKPWWLEKYRVTFDNELGIVGDVTLRFATAIIGTQKWYARHTELTNQFLMKRFTNSL